MNIKSSILLFLSLLFASLQGQAQQYSIDDSSFIDTAATLDTAGGSHENAPANNIDAGSIIVGHVTDAHFWHMFDYYDKEGNEKVVGIPLPIILIGENGLDVFLSSRFHHGHATYKGYKLVGGGKEMEEIICVDDQGNPRIDEQGSVIKPIDLSITKVSAAIMISVLLLIVLIMIAKRGYKKRENQAPRGLQSLVELLVVFVRDDIVRPMIGEKHYERYLPYMLTLFFFIFLSNVLGIIPFFPAGANITGNLAVTATLALITFIITNLSGNKHYWTDIFNTPGVPAWLKIFPLMPLVEFVGVFTKPIVLMIRLFANMTAGHIIVLGFITVIFIFANTISVWAGGAVSVVSILLSVFISLLECLVAYIQAFVFTMLSALYIGMAVAEPEHESK